ncbi:LytR/AlgR family response regulator transcription factor [Inhella gelatinilytica]|uniref:Response regulator transcription factor n=1 Tax=Inhella gelatinilytica TaxID=2795030 RepID=A0A931IZT6_9BURK|nr:LytTR family DNA-binding domain-containing protein [Inhella gelatinilytica]MBH9552968.1 response regulator transcription factor [Inhella gelatinilytica]
MNPIRALIADDEPHLIRHLQGLLSQTWPDLEVVATARNGLEAAERIAELQPDLAFLDIQMPGLTGLEVAQGIEGRTRVVFVTAYDEYAVQAFETAALDYLLKPLQLERLQRAVARLQASLVAPRADTGADPALTAALTALRPAVTSPLRFVRASSGELTHQIPIAEVLYFHADDKYTVVQTARGEHLIRTPIAELVAQLDPEQFWQVHRSTIVNLAHLAGTRRDEASRLFVRFLNHDRELPVSRAYVARFKAM